MGCFRSPTRPRSSPWRSDSASTSRSRGGLAQNGEAHPDEPLFTFAEGHTVDIELDNTIGPEHPFHLHGQFFTVLSDKAQPGLKDTVLVPGFTKVKIRAYLDNPGRWMAHCHILEHSELGMMSEIVVTPADGSGVPDPVGGHTH